MLRDKTIQVMTMSESPDGGGGWLPEVETEIAQIKAFITPIQSELLLKEYGIVSTQSFKVITFDDVPMKDHLGNVSYLKFEDESTYKVLQLSNYGREKILLVELI